MCHMTRSKINHTYNYLEAVDEKSYEKEVFVYSPNRKWKWLQKIIFWLLKKLKCEREQTVTCYKRTISFDNIKNAIWRQIYEVHNFYKKPKYIIVGQDAERDIFQDTSNFYSNVVIKPTPNGIMSEYMGLHIITVPWFKGMLVLPDINET